MLVLSLPRDVVEAALPAVERRLARHPDGWSNLAARGRLRRLLGDRGGLDDLRTAADTHLRVFAPDPSLLTAANLYRLAGDDRCQALLERLRAQPVDADLARGVLTDACFLLGDDAGVHEALAAMEPGPRHRAVAKLAAGRARRDLRLLDEAVSAFDRAARAERSPATGAMNAHDWLEIALVTRVQVSGEPSDRLVEL